MVASDMYIVFVNLFTAARTLSDDAILFAVAMRSTEYCAYTSLSKNAHAI